MRFFQTIENKMVAILEVVMNECRFTLGPDTWYPCYDSKIKQEKEVQPSKQQGSVWGWLFCSIKCSNYTRVFEYDFMKDKCECRGDFRPMMWRR